MHVIDICHEALSRPTQPVFSLRGLQEYFAKLSEDIQSSSFVPFTFMTPQCFNNVEVLARGGRSMTDAVLSRYAFTALTLRSLSC